jgi:hypothetical protein
MSLACVAGLVENLVSFAGGEALVPQVDGQPGERAKLGGEGLRFGGLGTDVAGEMDWIANNDAYDAKAAAEASYRAQVFSGNTGRRATPLQRQDWLCGKPQLVRHCNPDAAVADVESEIAKGSFQLLAPSF